MKLNGAIRIGQWRRMHADARRALERWVRVVEQARWTGAADVAAVFGRNADRVAHEGIVCWVFNIGGNKYRLVAFVDFELQEVTPRFFMTHAEYSKDRWKDQL